ncbi:recombinase family protein [Cryobacterium sp. MDB1-18-2]|uniref:recombinase family protein n=1 Tax=unclassified Cryobacterium TaxID=2649013 RepID=UPI00106C9197|nr:MULTISPECIES: recombinase family protein [unclassified Cryobacterium]TFC33471.1 recombinase family protein [Cryobacterium sp. MDB1-18-2]TFC46984.1 recombinase family protein [Cryobacterium sp. MDB1-18-1]
MKIGHGRVSTANQDLSIQLDALKTLGIDEKHTFVDHGLTGSGSARPDLEKVLAAVRAEDQLVVTKLKRLARSVRDAHDIASELYERAAALSFGGSVYYPTDATGKPLFNVLKRPVEFEADVIRIRTRKGNQVATAKWRLRGTKPKLSPAQEKHGAALYRPEKHATMELADDSGAARSTAYRAVEPAGKQ